MRSSRIFVFASIAALVLIIGFSLMRSGGKTAAPAPQTQKREREGPSKSINPQAGDVFDIDEDAHDSLVASGEPWIVKFFSPWCGHCRSMASAWVDTAVALKDKIHVGEVNCQEHRSLCSRYNVRGVPTILFIQGDKTAAHNGERTVESFRAFAEKHLGGE